MRRSGLLSLRGSRHSRHRVVAMQPSSTPASQGCRGSYYLQAHPSAPMCSTSTRCALQPKLGAIATHWPKSCAVEASVPAFTILVLCTTTSATGLILVSGSRECLRPNVRRGKSSPCPCILHCQTGISIASSPVCAPCSTLRHVERLFF